MNPGFSYAAVLHCTLQVNILICTFSVSVSLIGQTLHAMRYKNDQALHILILNTADVTIKFILNVFFEL